ncbi:hypothetical protein ACGFJ7_44765 [Actinoplanes sp. NPDC048988]|uniref:hypothetical protein n=1 Tax=Actinoplanes sp. NPDC048988 TaxID=3363901 RepID=UPI00370FEE90
MIRLGLDLPGLAEAIGATEDDAFDFLSGHVDYGDELPDSVGRLLTLLGCGLVDVADYDGAADDGEAYRIIKIEESRLLAVAGRNDE